MADPVYIVGSASPLQNQVGIYIDPIPVYDATDATPEPGLAGGYLAPWPVDVMADASPVLVAGRYVAPRPAYVVGSSAPVQNSAGRWVSPRPAYGVTGSLGGGQAPLRFAAAGVDIPDSTQSLGASTLFKQRTRHRFMANVPAIRICWPGYTISNTFTETGIGGSHTFQASLEFGGTVVAFTIGGGSSGPLTSGALNWTDDIPASAFGLTYFPAGFDFWLKLEVTMVGALPFRRPGARPVGYRASGPSTADLRS